MSNSVMAMPDHARRYLDNIRMEARYDYTRVPCEVCDSDNLEIVQDTIDIGMGQFGRLPVYGCRACGYVFQAERFEAQFYRDFYEKHYRSVLFGRTTPEKAFVADQVHRGRQLYSNLAEHLGAPGRLLDVGCSCGGLMVGFRDHGWEVYGTDPDLGFANFGRDRLKLPVDCLYAEDMKLAPASVDLIIITGSLEHVFDLGRVLSICRQASAPGALIVVEGRALGHSRIEGCFSHTHRRFFDSYSLPAALTRYGWTPLTVTQELLSGQTRPGGVFCIARASDKPCPPEPRDQADIAAHFQSIRKDTSRKLPQHHSLGANPEGG